MLSLMASVLIDHPDWREVNDRVEEALARQAGQAVVAARCRDRAVMLRRQGRHREALHELHRAKLDWWSGGTLRGALLVLLIAADSYQALGLDHAAAQCVLSAAYVAHDRTDPDHRDLMAPALALAARLEYRWGAWIGATELTELAIVTAANFQEGGVDPDSETMQPVLMHAGMIEAAATVYLGEAAGDVVAEVLERVGVGDLLGGDPRAAWRETGTLTTPDAWDDAARETLSGPPFQDAANAFVLRFSALGQEWSIRAGDAGEKECRRACERFAAAAQVLLLELSEDDLCLLATPVDVTIVVRGVPAGLNAKTRTTNKQRAWRFELSPADADVDVQMSELLEALTKVILDTSLLPGEAFLASMEAAFKRGLHHKLVPGRPYDDLRGAFEDKELRDKLGNARRAAVPKEWEGPATSALERPTGPGPTFSEEFAADLALGRYEKLARRIPRQLSALRSNPSFVQVREELRAGGWPDHLILLAIFNITMNHRVAVSGLDPFDAGDRERLQELQEQPETKGSPLAPASRFTVEEMDQARRLAMVSTLKLWDLTVHCPTPDLDAVEALLAERYAYWTADVEHDDPFPA
jgi:hypothetical protein